MKKQTNKELKELRVKFEQNAEYVTFGSYLDDFYMLRVGSEYIEVILSECLCDAIMDGISTTFWTYGMELPDPIKEVLALKKELGVNYGMLYRYCENDFDINWISHWNLEEVSRMRKDHKEHLG